MFDRRYAVAFGVIYAVVLAALIVTHHLTAFIVVAVIGGPTISVLYWLASRRPSPEVDPGAGVPLE